MSFLSYIRGLLNRNKSRNKNESVNNFIADEHTYKDMNDCVGNIIQNIDAFNRIHHGDVLRDVVCYEKYHGDYTSKEYEFGTLYKNILNRKNITMEIQFTISDYCYSKESGGAIEVRYNNMMSPYKDMADRMFTFYTEEMYKKALGYISDIIRLKGLKKNKKRNDEINGNKVLTIVKYHKIDISKYNKYVNELVDKKTKENG